MGKCFSVCNPGPSSVEEQNGKTSSGGGKAQLPPKTETIPDPSGQQLHFVQRNNSSRLGQHGGGGNGHRTGGSSVNSGSQQHQPPPHYNSRSSGENSRPFPHQNGVENHQNSSPSNSNPNPNPAMKSDFSERKANKLFEKYRDGSEDAILAEGMERFCQDLKVSPEDFIVLVLAWKFQAAVMCRFTRGEFVQGCRALRADSINSIKAKFPELLREVQAEEAPFKDLYRYTFGFGLDTEVGQRTLPCDIAIPLWKLVFHYRQPPILDRWCNFLAENQVKGISRDTWQMFLHFVEVIGDNLSNYDDNEAWPSLFDDFVEYENDRLKAGRQEIGDADNQEESHLV